MKSYSLKYVKENLIFNKKIFKELYSEQRNYIPYESNQEKCFLYFLSIKMSFPKIAVSVCLRHSFICLFKACRN